MAEFTAEQVRAEIRNVLIISDRERLDAMLEAFATRLEQDNTSRISTGILVNEQLTHRYELGREEGRREILAEIAKLEAFYEQSCREYCWFCEISLGIAEPQETPFPHKPDCLWLRAQAAIAPDTHQP